MRRRMTRVMTIAGMGRLTTAFCLIFALYTAVAGGNFSESLASAMGERKGAIVVLDVASGKLIAAHNLQLAATKTTTPGSSIKPFVLQAALESGRLDPMTPVACRRTLSINGHSLNCTHPVSANTLNATEALAYSCNSYFVKVATLFRKNELETRLQRFGLTSRTGLAKEESAGSIRTADTIAQRQLLVIGAAGIEVTPLELASAYRKLAQMRSADPALLAAPVAEGLESSVTYGMGHLAQSGKMKVAGKTGTASETNDPYTHAWFAGYAPAEKPEIVVVVFLERGRGSLDAASIAGRVFELYAQRRAK